jgi:hypothetical protein
VIRALWTIGLVGLLAVAPILIKDLGEAWWWAVSATAAVATVGAKLLEDRLKRRDQRREESARSLLNGTVGGGALRVRNLVDPVVLGAHRPYDYDEGPLPYVWREAQPAVMSHLTPGSFVLVVGDPLSGKTRLAYEAVRVALPGGRLVAPEDRVVLAVAVDAVSTNRGVLWLDDLERFLGPGGLTVAAVLRIAPGVILATIRRDQLRLLMQGESRRVLELAHQVPLERHLTSDELDRADEQCRHPGIDNAIVHADRYGLAEYLTANTAVRHEWTNAWSPGEHPRGAALVAAAADLSRAGFGEVLPTQLMIEIHAHYLDERGGQLLRPENLEEAWEWATEPRNATIALLQQVGDDHVRVFSSVVDQLSPESRKADTNAKMARILESQAARVTYVNQTLVPVALQSPAYSYSIYSPKHNDGKRQMGYTYDDVLNHKRTVLQSTGPEIRLFLGKYATHTRIGGSQGMAEQLAHLSELSERRAVEVRLLPLVGAYPGIEIANYTLIEFTDAYPVVRYETLIGNIYYDHIDEVDSAMQSIEHLAEHSPSSTDSLAIIDEARATHLTQA